MMAVEAMRTARAKAELKAAEAQPPPKSGKAAASKAVTVVPPINVLIVEGEYVKMANLDVRALITVLICV
jgi:hypothetical protein